MYLTTPIVKMILIFIIGFILGFGTVSFLIILSYIIHKLLTNYCDFIPYVNIDTFKFYYKKYNRKCITMLNKYGNYKIKKIYIIREPIGILFTSFINLFTWFEYNNYITKCKETDHYNYHGVILFELDTPEGPKFIKLEKQNCIMLSDEIDMSYKYDYMEVCIKSNKKYTLNKVFNKTRKRIGIEKWYNWDYSNNNCQHFIKEILISMNCFNENSSTFLVRGPDFLTSYGIYDIRNYVFYYMVFICNLFT